MIVANYHYNEKLFSTTPGAKADSQIRSAPPDKLTHKRCNKTFTHLFPKVRGNDNGLLQLTVVKFNNFKEIRREYVRLGASPTAVCMQIIIGVRTHVDQMTQRDWTLASMWQFISL